MSRLGSWFRGVGPSLSGIALPPRRHVGVAVAGRFG
jgi:hypothetical protein